MKMVRAKINWLFDKERIPPIIDENERKKKWLSYSPIIIFKGQYDIPVWEGNKTTVPTWSSVIFNENIDDKETISTVTYLVEKAPFELLQIGAEFELFEGANKVAYGIIIEELN